VDRMQKSIDEERGRSETEDGLQKIEKGKRRARKRGSGGEDIINAFSW
jgi:hypothetical protein